MGALTVCVPDPIRPVGVTTLGLPNVILAPRIARVTEPNPRSMALRAADIVIDAMSGKRPANTIKSQYWKEAHV
jgi:hypothetical protein